MKTSTVVWIIVVIVVIIGVAWWASNGSSAPATQQGESVPAGNLTLGENTDPTAGTYLVGGNGMTVYTYGSDTAGVSNCTGACATTWPPYITTATSTVDLVGEYPISGTLGTITRADGTMQITYNGMPLYFYTGDTAPDQITGQGVGGFSLAKP